MMHNVRWVSLRQAVPAIVRIRTKQDLAQIGSTVKATHCAKDVVAAIIVFWSDKCRERYDGYAPPY